MLGSLHFPWKINYFPDDCITDLFALKFHQIRVALYTADLRLAHAAFRTNRKRTRATLASRPNAMY